MFEEKFGDRAIARELVTSEQLQLALQAQIKSRSAGVSLRIGEILVRKKLVKPMDVKEVLRDQLIEIQWCSTCNKYYNCLGYEANAIYNCPLCRQPLQYSFDANAVAVEEDLSKEGQIYSDPAAIDQLLGGLTPAKPIPSPSAKHEITEEIPPDELSKMLKQETNRRRSAEPGPVPPKKNVIIRKPKKP